MKKEPPYRLHTSLGYHLSLASRLQERRLDEQLKTLGLTRTTWCILLAVGNEGLCQPSDIADFVGIDRTATSRALRHMEDDGLLAVCVQHEIDHLDGVLFVDHLSSIKRNMILRKLVKARRLGNDKPEKAPITAAV